MLQILRFLAGLGIFLAGLLVLNGAFRNINGSLLHDILHRFTKTPLKGLFLGTFITALVHSSSAVTVITISLVNTGALNLAQGLGIILGANIGTTLTAQVLALPLEDSSLIIFLLGLICWFLNKALSKFFISLALLFTGMDLLSSTFLDPEILPLVQTALSKTANPLAAVFLGTLVTAIIQSSGLVSGIILALAKNGQITLLSATGLILGANIGTCFTGVLASFMTNRTAKRLAWGNVFLNIGGVLLFYPFLPLFANLMVSLSSSLSQQVANTHTFFNIISSLLLLPLVTPFTKFLEDLIPEK